MSELSRIKDKLKEETSQFFQQRDLQIPDGWKLNIEPGGSNSNEGKVIDSEVYLYPNTIEDLDLDRSRKWFGKSIHETSHLKYNQNFSLPEIEEIENSSEDIIQEIKEDQVRAKNDSLDKHDLESLADLQWAIFFGRRDYSVAEDILGTNLEARIDSMSEFFSDEAVGSYIRKMGIMGVGEAQAIVIENGYLGEDLSSFDDRNISPSTLFDYTLRSNDMLNTDISSIGNYIDNHGYSNFLELSEEELIDRFYDEEKLLAI